MREGPEGPRLLLVGGGAGLVGRAVSAELYRDHRIRSVHRHPSALERTRGIEWARADLSQAIDWPRLLAGVDVVLNVAWYRSGPERKFRALHDGLQGLLKASVAANVGRFLQISVPASTPHLESTLPYLVYKRRFDSALARSGLSYAILRPSALFGPGDVLLGVMLRSIRRYPFFPMFGDGSYHLSPLSSSDLARVVRRFASSNETGTFDLGGPDRFRYRDLTDLMFRALGKRPRYWRLSQKGGIRIARILETLGSTLLYEYEVEWLLSDLLGLPPYEGLGRPLERVEPYLLEEARALVQPSQDPSGSPPQA